MPNRNLWKWIAITVAVLAFGSCSYFAFQPAGGPKFSDHDIELSVIETCQSSAKKKLKDPESARFDGWAATRSAEGKWSASGMVNAKNSYGAYEGSQPYTCTATINGDTVSAHAGPA